MVVFYCCLLVGFRCLFAGVTWYLCLLAVGLVVGLRLFGVCVNAYLLLACLLV